MPEVTQIVIELPGLSYGAGKDEVGSETLLSQIKYLGFILGKIKFEILYL